MSSAHRRILIAEDNDVSRELMARLLQSDGFEVSTAIDGGSAIKVVHDQDISLALVDLHMSPKGGFEFVKHLISEKMDIPVVLITADQSTDLLLEANRLGVVRVLQKPVDPAILKKVVGLTIKKKYGMAIDLGVAQYFEPSLSDQELMQKAIDLAGQNAEEGSGGPFGAVVADADGVIIGQGTTSRDVACDPIGYAEIIAIRQAAKKLNARTLENTKLFTVVEPSFLARCVIEEAGVSEVFYALTRDQLQMSDDDMSKTVKGGAKDLKNYTMLDVEAAQVFLKYQSKTK